MLSDASLGAMPRNGSQAGGVLCVAEPGVMTGPATVNVLEASSCRIKRVIRSSLGVETAACAANMEAGEYMRAVFAELLILLIEDLVVLRVRA